MGLKGVEKKYLKMYKDAGLPLIPLRGKIPFTPNWQNEPIQPESLHPKKFIDLNAGFVIPDNILVVDVDNRQTLSKLSEDLSIDILHEATVYVETGSGGLHLYFTKPDFVDVKHNLKNYPGLEFKSKGHKVVTAGSYHPDTGKMYDFGFDSLSLDELPEAPKSLLELIEKPYHGKRDLVIDIHDDSESSITKAREALKDFGPAVEGANGDSHTFQAACIVRDYGLSLETAFNLLLEWNNTCTPSWPENELHKKVENAYNYASNPSGTKNSAMVFKAMELTANDVTIKSLKTDADVDWKDSLQITKGGLLQKNFINTCLYLYHDPKLKNKIGFNEFVQDVYLLSPAPWSWDSPGEPWPEDGVQWTDNDDIYCKAYLHRQGLDISTAVVREAVIEVARLKRFHPVRDYLSSLRWDGKPRLKTWLPKYCHTEDNPYTRAVGVKTLTAACRRIFEPGCKFDHMTVFEGERGMYKSTTWDILGGRWYTDSTPDYRSKDAVEVARGKWIWEQSELDNYNRQEATAAKAFISRSTDRIRPSYGRRALDFPRQFIMVGTSNNIVLFDDTGERRVWPVKTGRINRTQLIKDRNQLWAEAMEYYKRGEELFLDTREAQDIADIEQEARFESDDWQDIIVEWLEKPENKHIETHTDSGKRFIRSIKIWTECLNRDTSAFSKREQIRVGSIMRKLGWERRNLRIKHHVNKVFIQK